MGNKRHFGAILYISKYLTVFACNCLSCFWQDLCVMHLNVQKHPQESLQRVATRITKHMDEFLGLQSQYGIIWFVSSMQQAFKSKKDD